MRDNFGKHFEDNFSINLVANWGKNFGTTSGTIFGTLFGTISGTFWTILGTISRTISRTIFRTISEIISRTIMGKFQRQFNGKLGYKIWNNFGDNDSLTNINLLDIATRYLVVTGTISSSPGLLRQYILLANIKQQTLSSYTNVLGSSSVDLLICRS